MKIPINISRKRVIEDWEEFLSYIKEHKSQQEYYGRPSYIAPPSFEQMFGYEIILEGNEIKTYKNQEKMEKPKNFAIKTRKENENLLKAIWQDLMEMGYIDASILPDKWELLGQNTPYENIESLEEFKDLSHSMRNEDRQYFTFERIFHIPSEYNEAVEFAKEQLEIAEEYFEGGFEIGKWYKHKLGHIIKYIGRPTGYGFDHKGKWVTGVYISTSQEWREAYPGEIKSAFIEYVKENYPEGCTIKQFSLNEGGNHGFEVRYQGFKYYPEETGRISDSPDPERFFIDGNLLIYKDGEWAEILKKEEKTLYFGDTEVKVIPDKGHVVLYNEGGRIIDKSEIDKVVRYIESAPVVNGYVMGMDINRIKFGCLGGSYHQIKDIQEALENE